MSSKKNAVSNISNLILHRVKDTTFLQNCDTLFTRINLMKSYFIRCILVGCQHLKALTKLPLKWTGYVNAVARQLNERPRKTLAYETPVERFKACVASIG